MAERFNRVDNTAPIVDVAEDLTPQAKKSSFDLNRKIITQALPYALIPIDTIPTMPNTELFLNYDVQITFRNPAIRKMLNGWRVYLHAYYNRNSELWEGWNNFITKGRSGNIALKIPHIANRISKKSPFTPMSLYNYLGYPSEYVPVKNTSGTKITQLDKFTGVTLSETEESTESSTNYKKTGLANYKNIQISALKAMMYQRLWRDKFSAKNLLQGNKNLFPDNEDHFILSYNADEVNVISYENENQTIMGDVSDKQFYTLNDDEKPVRLDCLRFRQFQGDRFTTASPFPEMLRGTIPNMELDVDVSELAIKANAIEIDTQVAMATDAPTILNGKRTALLNLPKASNANASTGTTNVYTDTQGRYRLLDTKISDEIETNLTNKMYLTNNNIIQNAIVDNNGSTIATVKSSVTLSQLRSLEVFTIFAERMARTNGDYNEMIKAQFGYNPNEKNREAIYIGGSYQDIALNSIYQTSESTEESALGKQVAQGISASYNKLGHFKADDYGYVMVVMSIMPETIYTTGISKLDTALTFEEQYFPIMNNLSAEPILNKELFVSGNEETDNDLWGYAERYSEWKSRRNKVSGFSELPNTLDEYDSALVMARRFDKTPNLNADFVTGYPDNYSLDGFTSDEEPPFDVAIRQDIMAYYPMPYVTIPQGLGTRA